jgi:hypothetical protein
MDDLEAEVRQMVLEFPKLKDFPDHSPIIGDFDVFEQRTVVSGQPGK